MGGNQKANSYSLLDFIMCCSLELLMLLLLQGLRWGDLCLLRMVHCPGLCRMLTMTPHQSGVILSLHSAIWHNTVHLHYFSELEPRHLHVCSPKIIVFWSWLYTIEVNAKDMVSGGALWELVRISRDCSREDIKVLAHRTLTSSPTFQGELKRLRIGYI